MSSLEEFFLYLPTAAFVTNFREIVPPFLVNFSSMFPALPYFHFKETKAIKLCSEYREGFLKIYVISVI